MDNYGYDDVQFVYTDSYEIAVRIHNSNRHVRICSSNPKISLDTNLNSIAVEGSLNIEVYSYSQDVIHGCFDIYGGN